MAAAKRRVDAIRPQPAPDQRVEQVRGGRFPHHQAARERARQRLVGVGAATEPAPRGRLARPELDAIDE
jgi:hypothetical protein